MTAACKFKVLGWEMKCPVCGQQVESGNQHECEQDNGVITVRRTWPIGPEKPAMAQPKRPAARKR